MFFTVVRKKYILFWGKGCNKFQSKCSDLVGEVDDFGSFSVTNIAKMSRWGESIVAKLFKWVKRK